MQKVKALNGYTIYRTTARDTRDGYSIGEYVVYFSSDVRDYGREYSTPEFDHLGSLEEAESNCGGFFALAKEELEEEYTAVTFEQIEARAAEMEQDAQILGADYLTNPNYYHPRRLYTVDDAGNITGRRYFIITGQWDNGMHTWSRCTRYGKHLDHCGTFYSAGVINGKMCAFLESIDSDDEQPETTGAEDPEESREETEAAPVYYVAFDVEAEKILFSITDEALLWAWMHCHTNKGETPDGHTVAVMEASPAQYAELVKEYGNN